MKKKHFFYISAVLPFFIVWAAWILTAFSFDVRETFQTSGFWGFTVCYYVLYTIIGPLIYEATREEQHYDYDKEEEKWDK